VQFGNAKWARADRVMSSNIDVFKEAAVFSFAYSIDFRRNKKVPIATGTLADEQ
jgi:hypothetical protein